MEDRAARRALPLSSDVSPSRRVRWTAIGAAVVGNLIEFYDFTVYAFFATSIAETFFPAGDRFAGLLLSVATFGVGFLTRPLGAVVIGAYADRAGRRPALMLTIAIMAAGTLLLTLTPGFATIGLAAPALVILARLLQGFALGGDVGAACSWLIESAPSERRGLVGSLQVASQGASILLAGLVGSALTAVLPVDVMASRGWRYAFAAGLLVIPVGLILRKLAPEAPKPTGGSRTTRDAVATLFCARGRTVLLGVLIITASTVTTYTIGYFATYATTVLHLPSKVGLWATAVAGLCTIGGVLCGGWLSDRWGRKFLTVAPRLLTILAAWPLFWMISQDRSAATFLIGVGLFSSLSALGAGVVFVAESFPTAHRGVGLALTYAIAIVLFGSSTQVVIAWLIEQSGDPTAPAWYVVATGFVGLVAALLMPSPEADRTV